VLSLHRRLWAFPVHVGSTVVKQTPLCHEDRNFLALKYEGNSESKVPYFYLEHKQVTTSNIWVRHRHICSLFFDVVSSPVALSTAVH
jgi:hypothetical protein